MDENNNEIICRDCGAKISSIDKYCPNCNAKTSTKSVGLIIAFITVGLLILGNLAALGFLIHKAYKFEQKNRISKFSQKHSYQKSKSIPVNSVDFSSYMRDMQKNIKINWNPPKLTKNTSVTLVYTIGKNGELLSYAVYKSSGNKEMDNSAIEALKATAPFKPLPAAFSKSSVDVKFTFDYNILKNK